MASQVLILMNGSDRTGGLHVLLMSQMRGNSKFDFVRWLIAAMAEYPERRATMIATRRRKDNGRKLLVYVGIAAMLMMVSVVSAHPSVPQNDVLVDVTPDSQTGRSGDTLTYTVNLTNNGTVQDIIVVDSITCALQDGRSN